MPEDPLNDETSFIDPLSSNDPWQVVYAVRDMPQTQRPQYLDPWLTMLLGRSDVERDALLAVGREVWKYRMETVRARLKEMRGDEQPTHQLVPTLLTEKFLAEAIVKKLGKKPEMAFAIQTFENPDAEPEILDQIAWEGVTYKPLYSVLYEHTVLMPSGIEEYGTDYDLFRDLRGFVGTYLHLEDTAFKTLACCYILMTWVHDRFDVLPYLRVQGDLGVGKTRFLQTIGSLCYRPMMAGGATTPSPIFRIIDRFHGTLIIDEADFEKSEIHDEITKILNFGNQSGFPVLRSERDAGDNFDVKAYDVYGPKILSTRRRFQDAALESRCLSHTMPIVYESIRKDMHLSLSAEFRTSALQLRNRLLLWRLRRFSSIQLDRSARYPDLELRVNQIIQPILTCVEDPRLRAAVEGRVQEYSRMVRADRRDSLEGVIVAAMLWVWIQSRRPAQFLMKQISERIRADHEYLKITDKRVGDVLRRVLGVSTIQRGGYTYVELTEEQATVLAKRYGADPESTLTTTRAPAPVGNGV